MTKKILHLKPKKSLGVKKFEKKVKPGRASPLVAGPAVPRLATSPPLLPEVHGSTGASATGVGCSSEREEREENEREKEPEKR